MDHKEVRAKYLDFFKGKGHEVVASSSLIPRDDPTLLFTNAGMVQFKGLFLGEEKRGYTRAATSQKCVRAGGKHNDLENVGYTARHHTFFEMLGNFSFGDYFKEEAITWAWELLMEGYKLDKERLHITIYKDDDEAHDIWEKKIGIPASRITRLGEKDNFWAMGDTGPCGPCSEIHFDQGASVGCGRPDCGPACDCDRFLEIWNLVFTQFDRDPSGKLTPLPKPNIDTGMGLERVTAVIQGVKSNYDTDIFSVPINRIQELSSIKYRQNERFDLSFRVISDHARAAAFLIGDGIMPSNEGRGYVLRRIIRRAIRYGQVLGFKGPFFHSVAESVIDAMGDHYTDLEGSRSFIKGVLVNEEKRFADTLFYSMKMLGDEIEKIKSSRGNVIPGELAFKLYDTYGLSLDIVQDVARDEGLTIDMESYEKSMSSQRNQSRESWKGSGEEKIPEAYKKLASDGCQCNFIRDQAEEFKSKVAAILVDGKEVSHAKVNDAVEIVLASTPFYGESGGQVGDQGMLSNNSVKIKVSDTIKAGSDLVIHKGTVESGSIKTGDEITALVDYERRRAIQANHTATHLLHSALREIIGDHVKQAGSQVSAERLRFDFSHFAQVEKEKLMEVEALVNMHIRDNHPVTTEVMTREDASKTGAMAIFEERYGANVRVVSVGEGVSMELCGGTHTHNTGDIGFFKIVSEGAVAANVRRIEAVTGKAAVLFSQTQDNEIKEASALLKTTPDQLIEKINQVLKDQKQKDAEIDALKAKIISKESGDILSGLKEINGIKVLAKELDAPSPKELRDYVDRIREKLASGVIVLGSKSEDKVMLICAVTNDLTKRYNAGKIIKEMSEIVGGKGGGRPDMAQGGGSDPQKLTRALESIDKIIAG
ncbi:MAG: alanine--tRNA ligase [Deltaproteobacteria bacterium]|nr:alanine--tRNA ligase [Deltaproteobacteria bacterium]